MLIFFSTSMYFIGIIIFSLKRKHLLMLLLSLEFIIISLFLNIAFVLSSYGYEMFFLMVFLTFSVCESALGLSILVSLIRSYGNDYFSTFNVLW